MFGSQGENKYQFCHIYFFNIWKPCKLISHYRGLLSKFISFSVFSPQLIEVDGSTIF